MPAILLQDIQMAVTEREAPGMNEISSIILRPRPGGQTVFLFSQANSTHIFPFKSDSVCEHKVHGKWSKEAGNGLVGRKKKITQKVFIQSFHVSGTSQ